jgi:hypothetical protein
MNVAKIGAWPGLLSLNLAAMYCDMKPRDFLKAVAVGALPDPVIINGQERWRLVEHYGLIKQAYP